MAWANEDPSSFAVTTYLQSASVLPVFCRVDAIRTVPGNHAIELTASRRLPQQAWVSLRWPDMYPESCVRQELPHEGPSFFRRNMPARRCSCVSRTGNHLGLITCSSGDHQWKSTVMSGDQTWKPLGNQQSCSQSQTCVLLVCQSSYRLLFSFLSPIPSFWSSVSELSSSFLVFSPFLSDDDKDHDDITKVWRLLSLSAELLSALLALSPLFPPSGRLSAELSSSSLACSPFPLSGDDDDDDDHAED